MSTNQALKDALSKFDFFAHTFGFNVNGKHSFRSAFGGIICLVVAFPVLYHILRLGILMINARKYVINIHNEIVETPDPINLHKKEVFENILYLSSTADFFEASDFEVSMYRRINKNGYGSHNHEDTSIKLVECKSPQFPEIVQQKDRVLLCPDLDYFDERMTIKGSTQKGEFTSITVILTPSKGISVEQLAAKYIDHMVYLNWISTDIEIKYLERNDIIKKIPYTTKFVVNFSEVKRFLMFFRTYFCDFNNGILFSDPDKFVFHRKELIDDFRVPRNNTKKYKSVFLEIEAVLDVKKTYIERSFYKLEEYISDAGGLFSNFIFFFYFVTKHFNEKQGTISILNRVFQFRNVLLDSRKVQKIKEDVFPPQNKSSPKNLKQVGVYSNPSQTLNLLWISLCWCCVGRRHKSIMKRYFKGEEYLRYYLDVVTYLNKMQQISLVTDILLNDDQKTAFKFLSKPEINDYRLNKEKDEVLDFKPDTLSDKETSTLKNAVSSLQREGDKVSNRLVEMVERKLDYLCASHY